jgi:hypothetical protein
LSWSYNIVAEGAVHPLRDGTLFPEAATVSALEADDLTLIVVMRLRVLPMGELEGRTWRGQPALTELMVGPAPPLYPRELRDEEVAGLPISALKREAIRHVAAHVMAGASGERWVMGLPSAGAGQTQRQRHMTPELAAEIARVVREDRSGKPTEAVSKEFRVSHRTATRWIAAARKEAEVEEGYGAAKEMFEPDERYKPRLPAGMIEATRTPVWEQSAEELEELERIAEAVLATPLTRPVAPEMPQESTPDKRRDPA